MLGVILACLMRLFACLVYVFCVTCESCSEQMTLPEISCHDHLA